MNRPPAPGDEGDGAIAQPRTLRLNETSYWPAESRTDDVAPVDCPGTGVPAMQTVAASTSAAQSATPAGRTRPRVDSRMSAPVRALGPTLAEVTAFRPRSAVFTPALSCGEPTELRAGDARGDGGAAADDDDREGGGDVGVGDRDFREVFMGVLFSGVEEDLSRQRRAPRHPHDPDGPLPPRHHPPSRQ